MHRFMGTKKYPQVNEFDAFLSHNSGVNNAETANLNTTFTFECDNNAYPQALDIFS